ncbi:Predicted arabinose efflux permease, MFS family [Duganella sacchari]|uniref:Predicted arabinose efflux permease, MFS family n=1 Tax=Duganella sacchari TaxID=551987 RepID=A0A1M7Q550_9BURK|nr:MFS transporter [Duganella sacchari]SHN25471.1 Predicted arabinose efflux permease, MFS family [Duganella sacchari]
MKNMPWRDFSALVASIGVVGLGLGATIPLTALTLDQRGIGSGIIGIMTAISAFGILAAAPFVSRWVAVHGPRGCMIGAIIMAAQSTALMEATDSLLAWGVLRFIFGACMGVLFTIGEAWVNNLAPVESRGRVVAMYTTAFTLFQLIGPAMVAGLSGSVPLPFASCGVLFLLALPGMLLISGGAQGHEDEPQVAWHRILPRMWMIAIGAAFFAMFDTVALSLLPLYAMRHGIATELAVLSATVVLVGDTALQFAFGWLADHVGRRKVHIGCGIAVCVLLPILPFAAGTPWLWWTLLLVLGAVAGAIYMLSLVACGERFDGQSLVAASAVVNASWGITSAGGPLVTGVLMQTAGINALPAVLWCGAAIFIASAFWEYRQGYKD